MCVRFMTSKEEFCYRSNGRGQSLPVLLFLSFVVIFCCTTVLIYECEMRRHFKSHGGGPLFFEEKIENASSTNEYLAGGAPPKVKIAHNQNPGNTLFVISLQGTPGADKKNIGRLDKFHDAIRESCGDKPLRIIHCPGVVDSRRGYGLTKAHTTCFNRAITIDQEVSFFFEDDARPFSDKVDIFCDLLCGSRKIIRYVPEDSLMTFLGGHEWQTETTTTYSNVLESHFSYGTYAFAVPRRNLKLLLVNAENDLVNGFVDDHNNYLHSDFLSPEKSLYRLARQSKLKIYVASPLLIWHKEGYSNTWKRQRKAEIGAVPLEIGKDKIATGAFANCSFSDMILSNPSDNAPSSMQFSTRQQIVVSCRSFNYKARIESFREVNATLIIVGVLSHARNKERRQTIRATWAKDRPGVFFVVAGDWRDISEEYYAFQDLIWIDIKEDFGEITYKSAAFFAVVNQAAEELGVLDYAYAMKTDDDSYVALDRIVMYINNHGGKPDYIGKCVGPRKPFRSKNSRYYTAFREYPEELFPEYCQGLGFLLSSGLNSCVAKNMAHSRFLKHEDVFIGAMAKRCNVKHILAVPELHFRPYRSGCTCNDLRSVRKEMERLDHDNRPVSDSVFPSAEMAAKVIQHRINSDKDMIHHHESATNNQIISKPSDFNAGDEVDYYYSDEQGWFRSTILALGTNAENSTVELKNNFDGSIQEVPFLPYLGNFRKLNV